MSTEYLNLFPTLLTLCLGMALGYLLHYLFFKRKNQQAKLKINELEKTIAQKESNYQILLQAMEGAKAQAETMQRKLYGSNVIEIKEFQDPESILNRQKLVKFVEKKLKPSSAKTDDSKKAQPSNAKALESLKGLDAEVVNILTEVIEE